MVANGLACPSTPEAGIEAVFTLAGDSGRAWTCRLGGAWTCVTQVAPPFPSTLAVSDGTYETEPIVMHLDRRAFAEFQRQIDEANAELVQVMIPPGRRGPLCLRCDRPVEAFDVKHASVMVRIGARCHGERFGASITESELLRRGWSVDDWLRTVRFRSALPLPEEVNEDGSVTMADGSRWMKLPPCGHADCLALGQGTGCEVARRARER